MNDGPKLFYACDSLTLVIWRETVQGQAFGTTSIPPTILFLFSEITTGVIADCPQTMSDKHRFSNSVAFVLCMMKCGDLCISNKYFIQFAFIGRDKVSNCDTFTELSSKIVITEANSIASFIGNTASSIITCNIRTGWINF